MPSSFMIFVYDETGKTLLRRNADWIEKGLIIKFNQNESIGVDSFISLLVAVAAAPAVDLTPHAIPHAIPAAVSHSLGLPEAVGCAHSKSQTGPGGSHRSLRLMFIKSV